MAAMTNPYGTGDTPDNQGIYPRYAITIWTSDDIASPYALEAVFPGPGGANPGDYDLSLLETILTAAAHAVVGSNGVTQVQVSRYDETTTLVVNAT